MRISGDHINGLPVASNKALPLKEGRESLESQKARLKKATREFESFFIMYMLKAMRSTIPKSGLADSGLGQDVYTSMFDQELAKKMADGSPNSLAELLYSSLEPTLESSGEESFLVDKHINSRPVFDIKGPDNTTGLPINRKNSVPSSLRPTMQIDVTSIESQYPAGEPTVIEDSLLDNYGSAIEEASRRYNLDPRLIYSVIMVESGGKADAVSPKGAKGLMQLMDSTAADMGVVDSLNPRHNIDGGAKYLRQLLDRFDGDLKLTLAAYNAGPGAVSKYNGVPPFSETREYIAQVLGQLHK